MINGPVTWALPGPVCAMEANGLRDILSLHTHISRAEVSQVRVLENPLKIAIPLGPLGSLTCRPRGASEAVAVNDAFLSEWVLQDAGTGFRPSATDAISALLTAHPAFPQHFTPSTPNYDDYDNATHSSGNSRSSSRSSSRSRGRQGAGKSDAASAVIGLPAPLQGTAAEATPAESGPCLHPGTAVGMEAAAGAANMAAEAGAAPGAAMMEASHGGAAPMLVGTAATEAGSAPEAGAAAEGAAGSVPSTAWWPAAAARRVLKANPTTSNATCKKGPAIHDNAAWYTCYCCAMYKHGCPARCIVLQHRDAAGGATGDLQVLFNGNCRHPPAAAAVQPVGSLRGHQRQKLADQAGGRAAAHVHVLASAARPLEHQLDRNVSTTGKNAHVVRQALHERSCAQNQRDKDVLLSVEARRVEVAAIDKARTPVQDQAHRLFHGDTPMMTLLPDGHFFLVHMTEAQLRRFVFCVQKGASGILMDTVGELVSELANGAIVEWPDPVLPDKPAELQHCFIILP